MGAIEELMYEAYELGLQEEVIKEAGKLKDRPKYRYSPLVNIYEDAFNNIINKENEKKKTM
mgnify:CR=1 FL=1|tara:strand:- start:39 stop:221 length:183 start_codon:yes stop_codon:yes gene_type:complete